MSTKTDGKWLKAAQSVLLGRKIISTRYMTQAEVDHFGWSYRAIVIELDNGVELFPSSDDEGNEAGALFTTNKEHPVLPVL